MCMAGNSCQTESVCVQARLTRASTEKGQAGRGKRNAKRRRQVNICLIFRLIVCLIFRLISA